MPEGDAVYKDAVRLRPLVGTPLTFRCRWPRVVDGLGPLTEVSTHGKHLLLGFERHVLRVHRRMKGYWRHFHSDGFPAEDLTLALLHHDGAAVLYAAPVVERIDRRALATHPVLTSLGPDVLDEQFDATAAVLRAPPQLTAGEALLDQRIAAGIGNVYRAETLFFERVDPFIPLGDVDRPERLWARASSLMRANLAPGRAMQTRTNGPPDHWVYGRARQPCLRCRTRVRAARLGEPQRTVYWCPRCQG